MERCPKCNGDFTATQEGRLKFWKIRCKDCGHWEFGTDYDSVLDLWKRNTDNDLGLFMRVENANTIESAAKIAAKKKNVRMLLEMINRDPRSNTKHVINACIDYNARDVLDDLLEFIPESVIKIMLLITFSKAEDKFTEDLLKHVQPSPQLLKAAEIFVEKHKSDKRKSVTSNRILKAVEATVN